MSRVVSSSVQRVGRAVADSTMYLPNAIILPDSLNFKQNFLKMASRCWWDDGNGTTPSAAGEGMSSTHDPPVDEVLVESAVHPYVGAPTLRGIARFPSGYREMLFSQPYVGRVSIPAELGLSHLSLRTPQGMHECLFVANRPEPRVTSLHLPSTRDPERACKGWWTSALLYWAPCCAYGKSLYHALGRSR